MRRPARRFPVSLSSPVRGIEGASPFRRAAEGSGRPRRQGASKSLRFALLALGIAIALSGCVRRRLFVRSDPPGAALYVDDQHIGFTPTYVTYRYYGTRKIQLIKDGHETVTVYHRLDSPWYQIPPLDFVSENLVPTEIRDERVLDFTLPPMRIVEESEILPSAEALRSQVQSGTVVPLPPQTAPPPVAP